MRLLAIFLVSIFLFPPVSSATTLEDLIETAKKENPELKAIESKVKAMEQRAIVEGSLDDPMFKVEFMDLPRDNPIPYPSNAMQTRYSLTQTIPFPGRLGLKKAFTSSAAGQMAAELKAKELEILSSIKTAYFDYLYDVKAIKTTTEIKGIIDALKKVAEIKYSTGLTPQQDVIKAEVELSMIDTELAELEARKDIAKINLNGLIGRKPDTPIGGEIEGYKHERPRLNVEELSKTAFEKSPMLLAINSNIKEAEIGKELSKRKYSIDFMFEMAAVQREDRFPDTWNLMFGITLPIWSGKYRGMQAEAGYSLESAKASLENTRINILKELNDEVRMLKATERILELYEKSLAPMAEIGFKSSLVSYETGRVDFMTVIEGERTLKKTKIDYLRATADYWQRLSEIEKIVGEELM